MTPAAIQSEIRSLTRQLKALRRKLRGSPAAAFKGPTRKEAKKAKRETAAERRRRVYAEVDARSNRRCEAWGLEIVPPPSHVGTLAHEHDHAWGRGKAPESVETIWALCLSCHRNKTDGVPSRAYWIEVFRLHSDRNGYAAQVAKCDAAIALERAQHPDAGKGRP